MATVPETKAPSQSPAATAPTAASTLPELYRFSLEDYHRMGELGIIPADQRVELIEGVVCAMSPTGSPHSGTVAFLTRVFALQANDRYITWPQNPIVLPPNSEPEPDVALLKPRNDFYRTAHPQPSDVLLLIEVADSSMDVDLGKKRELYAAAGVVECWVLDVAKRELHLHREPSGQAYAQQTRLTAKDTATPAAFADVQFKLADVFNY